MYIICFYSQYKFSGTFPISGTIQQDITIQDIRPYRNVLHIFARFKPTQKIYEIPSSGNKWRNAGWPISNFMFHVTSQSQQLVSCQR